MSEKKTTLEDFDINEGGSEDNEIAPPTELAGIPADWSSVRLDNVSLDEEGAFVDGPFGSNLKAGEMAEKGFARVVQLQNIRSSEFIDSNHKYISEGKFEELKRHGAKPGDLAIAKMAEPVARACLLPEIENQYIVVADCIKLSVDESEHNSKFVMFALNSRPVWKQAYARSRGSTRKRINLTQLKQVQVPSPSIAEQRKIATILYTVDRAIEKTDEIIEQTERVREGTSQDLFRYGISQGKTKETWLGEIPEDWEVVQFSEIVESNRNGLYKSKDAYGKGCPIAKMGNALEKRTLDMSSADRLELTDSEKEKYGLQEGDLIFARRAQEASAAGDCCYVPELDELTVFESSLIRVRLAEEANPRFYTQYFDSPVGSRSIERIITETSISGIATSDLLDLKVALPSQAEQSEIADIMWQFDKQMKALKEERKQYEKFKRGLVQDLFSGKVRTTNTNIEVPEEVAQHG